MQQLSERVTYLEQQNELYVKENKALREAVVEQEERQKAEIDELKKSQLNRIRPSEPDELLLLQNLLKVKDEEIRQLKYQLGVSELGNNSSARDSASPLRPNKLSFSGSKTESL